MTFADRVRLTNETRDSLLCVGLDPDRSKLPSCLHNEKEPTLKFCREIISATEDFAAAYKINFAFFEAEGAAGWNALEHLVHSLPNNIIKIADAKRADIGNTSGMYAHAILERLYFDAVTVNPYMGFDSIAPFLQWPEKGAFVLCLTSNPGSKTFQHLKAADGRHLYENVAEEVVTWNSSGNCGLVAGATHGAPLAALRTLAPGLPFLIPGVGAQGGGLQQAVQFGTDDCGHLAFINASRSILYRSDGADFADAARDEAQSLHSQMKAHQDQKREALQNS